MLSFAERPSVFAVLLAVGTDVEVFGVPFVTGAAGGMIGLCGRGFEGVRSI